MTIDDFIKVPWSRHWKCQGPIKKYATFRVVFSYKIRPPYRVLDETEFDIDTTDDNDLVNLFNDFCKENDFSDVEVVEIIIVRTAKTMEELIEMERKCS